MYTAGFKPASVIYFYFIYFSLHVRHFQVSVCD
jgi:hypothetical protein